MALLQLYKATGLHQTAAEHYAQYAQFQRDQLGVEPPELETF